MDLLKYLTEQSPRSDHRGQVFAGPLPFSGAHVRQKRLLSSIPSKGLLAKGTEGSLKSSTENRLASLKATFGLCAGCDMWGESWVVVPGFKEKKVIGPLGRFRYRPCEARGVASKASGG